MVSGAAPEDYRKPEQFFSHLLYQGHLRDHAGMVLSDSAAKRTTPPLCALITQFGGGKGHTLATLYHLVRHADKARALHGVTGFLDEAGLAEAPQARSVCLSVMPGTLRKG
ncbi:MAG: hypothetical protein MZV70_44410 [Desulfobacterales bacterium]|nr:hypothetical protein [Desulfobacterales bacterium]